MDPTLFKALVKKKKKKKKKEEKMERKKEEKRRKKEEHWKFDLVSQNWRSLMINPFHSQHLGTQGVKVVCKLTLSTRTTLD